MYQSHFCLSGRPFAAAPNPEHYFPASSIERARESLVMSIQRAAGSAVVIGAVGTGKTLLCQLIANQFSPELPVCMLSSVRLCTRRTLVQTVLNRLGLPIRNLDEGELHLNLTDHISGPSCPRGILLIVDEADRLPLELLEEFRMITNLVQNGEPRVRLMLLGGVRLEERMSHPRMESLNQRVVARLYLDNFTADETANYIRARITACGGVAETLFNDEALQAVYQVTSGVPRLVNQVCDHALILAAVGAHGRLDADGIEEAWSDLQQLPLPPRVVTTTWQAEETDSNVVEFGSLDDEVDERSALPDQSRFDPTRQLEGIERQIVSIGEEASVASSPTVNANSEAIDDMGRVISMRPHLSAQAHTAESHESYDDVGGHDLSRDQATELDLEELGNSGSTVPAIAPTIDQATDPFDEEFAEEEVVISQFAAPSETARRSEFEVVSNDSRELARQLTAAHPGLRMHPQQDVVDLEDRDSGESERFQPLTVYMHNANDPRAFEEELDVAELETEDGETNESAPHIVSSELHNALEEPATDASEQMGPEVVVHFNHIPVDWDGDSVMLETEIEALGPARNYSSDDHVLVEELQPDLHALVVHNVPQPEVISKDQGVTQNDVPSAGFNPATYQETGSNSASPLESIGPSDAPLAQDIATPELPEDVRPEPATVKPKVFRRLFSDLRQTDDDVD